MASQFNKPRSKCPSTINQFHCKGKYGVLKANYGVHVKLPSSYKEKNSGNKIVPIFSIFSQLRKLYTQRVDRWNRCTEEENRGHDHNHTLHTITHRVGNWRYLLQYHIWNLHGKLVLGGCRNTAFQKIQIWGYQYQHSSVAYTSSGQTLSQLILVLAGKDSLLSKIKENITAKRLNTRWWLNVQAHMFISYE